MSNHILTFSGLYVDPLNLQVEDVRLEDVAHSLSMQTRWGGHVKTFYSVAEHSVRVAEILADDQEDPETILLGLLHDGSEAYLIDLPRPLKMAPGFGEIYRRVEAQVQQTVLKAFGVHVDDPKPPVVSAADNRMMVTERRDLMHWKDIPEGDVQWANLEGIEPVLPNIVALEWGRAEDLWTSCVLATLAQVHGTLGTTVERPPEPSEAEPSP